MKAIWLYSTLIYLASSQHTFADIASEPPADSEITLPGLTEPTPPVASPKPRRKFEMQFAPKLGYSNFAGIRLGSAVALLIPLNQHWQWKLGAGAQFSKSESISRYTVGAQYNFDEDWAQSFYVGAGAGYLIDEFTVDGQSYSAANVFSYVEIGKRVKMNSSGTWTWTPHIMIESSGQPQFAIHSSLHPSATLSFHPLNFSWSF